MTSSLLRVRVCRLTGTRFIIHSHEPGRRGGHATLGIQCPRSSCTPRGAARSWCRCRQPQPTTGSLPWSVIQGSSDCQGMADQRQEGKNCGRHEATCINKAGLLSRAIPPREGEAHVPVSGIVVPGSGASLRGSRIGLSPTGGREFYCRGTGRVR